MLAGVITQFQPNPKPFVTIPPDSTLRRAERLCIHTSVSSRTTTGTSPLHDTTKPTGFNGGLRSFGYKNRLALDELQVDRDVHLFADQDATRLQRSVPDQAKVLAVDL